MSENKRLAVVILTKNEEKHIAACMASAAFADEILVIDSGSTDGTQAIAEAHGARFIPHPMTDEGFAGQRNFALTQTQADWVLYLDADERITPELAASVQAVVAGEPTMAYCLHRVNVVFGQTMYHGAHRPDRCLRLFPRTQVTWHGRVHEGAQTPLHTQLLTGNLLHHTYDTWQQYFTKFNHYTTLAAESYYASGRRISRGTVVAHSLFAFLRNYILHLGFLDGFLGLVMSLAASFYTMTKYLKAINTYRLQEKK